jgi:putative phage-type endonuclease
MKIDIEQRSPEWHEFRKDKIGASEIGTIMGLNPYETPLQWWERRKGLRDVKPVTQAMQSGIELESEALLWANAHLLDKFYPAVYQSEDNLDMIASLDGINADGSVCVEIKCSKKIYDKSLKNEIDEMYRAQIQMQLYCSGADYGIFVAYHVYCSGADYGIFHEGKGNTIKVDRDEDYIKRIVEAAKIAKEVWLDQNIPPEPDHIDIEIDENQAEIVKAYMEAVHNKKTFEALEKKLKKKIEDMGDDQDFLLLYEGTPLVKMCRIQPEGRVDWDAVCTAHGIREEALNQYRKPVGIGYYRANIVGEI